MEGFIAFLVGFHLLVKGLANVWGVYTRWGKGFTLFWLDPRAGGVLLIFACGIIAIMIHIASPFIMWCTS